MGKGKIGGFGEKAEFVKKRGDLMRVNSDFEKLAADNN